MIHTLTTRAIQFYLSDTQAEIMGCFLYTSFTYGLTLLSCALCVLPFGYLDMFQGVFSFCWIGVCPVHLAVHSFTLKCVRKISAIASLLHYMLRLIGDVGWPSAYTFVLLLHDFIDEFMYVLPVARTLKHLSHQVINTNVTNLAEPSFKLLL